MRGVKTLDHVYTNMHTNLFNLSIQFNSILSLPQAPFPTYFQATSIMLVPKDPTTMSPNDFCPVALNLTILKCFKGSWSWLTSKPTTLDPFHFTFCQKRSTEDTISTALRSTLSHLDNNIYVRMLFIDFSSTFNTIIPSKIITKLTGLGINTGLSN